jgi:general secretion pathway protein L
MLRDLLRWWVGQLADSVPERWRHFGSTSGDALVITPIEPVAGGINAVAASLRRNGKEMPLGRFSLGGAGLAGLPQLNGRPAVLRLSESDVLLKTVTLPLAAERQLDQVLAFEMERETPFGTDEIYWSHFVTERDRQRGQLLVQLLLVPRASLAPLLGALADFGITPKRAEIAAGKNQNCYLPLDAHSGRLHDGATSARLLRWAAVTLCASLAVAAVAIPFACQSWDLAELDQKIAAGRAAVAEAETLRGEIERLSGMANLIESERDKAGRPLVTLAALTRMLPDDTYINELQLQQHKLTISGRSAAASRLISALSAGNQLRNPTFAAPVTRIEATRSEIFSITAEVGP